jgi:hypothetical protein
MLYYNHLTYLNSLKFGQIIVYNPDLKSCAHLKKKKKKKKKKKGVEYLALSLPFTI